MCLGVPARVVSVGKDLRAEAEIGGVRREVDLNLVPETNVGDYVLIHAGYAIQRIDKEEAKKTLELLRQMAESADEAER